MGEQKKSITSALFASFFCVCVNVLPKKKQNKKKNAWLMTSRWKTCTSLLSEKEASATELMDDLTVQIISDHEANHDKTIHLKTKAFFFFFSRWSWTSSPKRGGGGEWAEQKHSTSLNPSSSLNRKPFSLRKSSQMSPSSARPRQ